MPTHRVGKDDDLRSLALRYYGDLSARRLIFEANRGVLPDEHTPLTPGLLLIIPLNAEDAADWADLTDDGYGVDRGFKPKSRVDFGPDPEETIRRVGYFEGDDEPGIFDWKFLVFRLAFVTALGLVASFILHVLGVVDIVPP